MSFNSIGFAFFFALVFAVYFLPAMARARRQNILLLCASYFFYGVWDWRFLSLIVLTTLVSWGGALAMERWRRSAQSICVAGVAVNLLVLGFFKYFNFFGENLAYLMRLLGFPFDWVVTDIMLPVGISFYTFQAIGYSIDVYRREVAPTRDLLLFATFIAYFPQLVAGPIERASRLLPQLSVARSWSRGESVEGLRRILWGLVKKVAIADQCAVYVDRVWGTELLTGHDAVAVFVAVLLFSVQIYCDFSGYCDIAVGTSRILGIRLMENFRRPYFALSVFDFWRRWHVSLMEWFRNYVYIPLGGSRVSRGRLFGNVFVVFLLSGLWHGASWCYVLWGVYWAVVCGTARVFGFSAGKERVASASAADICRMAGTLVFVVVGWGIFRSRTLAQCGEYVLQAILPLTLLAATAACAGYRILLLLVSRKYGRRLLRCAAVVVCAGIVVVFPAALLVRLYWPLTLVVLVCEWRTRNKADRLFPLPDRRLHRYVVYALLYLAVVTAPDSEAQFIYFQF